MVGTGGTAPRTGQRHAAWARAAVAVAIIDTAALTAALAVAAASGMHYCGALPRTASGSTWSPARRSRCWPRSCCAPGAATRAARRTRTGSPGCSSASARCAPRRSCCASSWSTAWVITGRSPWPAPGCPAGCGPQCPPVSCWPCCGSRPATCPVPAGAGPSAASPSPAPRSGWPPRSRRGRCRTLPATSRNPLGWAGAAPALHVIGAAGMIILGRHRGRHPRLGGLAVLPRRRCRPRPAALAAGRASR